MRKKISAQELMLFTKHFSTMIKAGITVPQALASLSSQIKSNKFKKIVGDILSEVENGQSLYKALFKYKETFGSFYISIIEISEKSGTLEENLDYLSSQLSKEFNLRKKVQGAMMYPALVIIATFIMGGFISLFVLPKLVDFFGSFEIELPLSTKILLTFANLMKNHGIEIFGGILIFSFLFSLFIKIKFIKPFWQRFLISIPFVGKIIVFNNLANMSRNLGILLKSGVTITDSFLILSKSTNNEIYKKYYLKLVEVIKKGGKISEQMNKYSNTIFPKIVPQMIAAGEETGRLDETLLYLGTFYEDEIDDLSKSLATLLEPILLLGIGLVVGFVALSIISPIYQLTGSIRS